MHKYNNNNINIDIVNLLTNNRTFDTRLLFFFKFLCNVFQRIMLL